MLPVAPTAGLGLDGLKLVATQLARANNPPKGFLVFSDSQAFYAHATPFTVTVAGQVQTPLSER